MLLDTDEDNVKHDEHGMKGISWVNKINPKLISQNEENQKGNACLAELTFMQDDEENK